MWRKPRTQPESERTVYVISDEDPSLQPARTTTVVIPTAKPLPSYTLGESETRTKRLLFHCLAIAITVGYCYFFLCFFAPAPCRPGIDENAYLVGGRMIAEHGSPSLNPTHPLSFIGSMWVLSAKNGLYYPKYPAGLPLLYAILLKLLGPIRGATASFFLSPACAVVASYFTFLLARRIVGSFHAVLSMIVLATGMTTLQLCIEPNSHAPCLCFTVAGMYFLIRYLQTDRVRWGVVAGFLLGYAVTIRYSEGLNGLTLGAAVLMTLRRPVFAVRPLLKRAAPLLAWGVPVGTLAVFNWFTVGHFSGYGATSESTGFTMTEFWRKWEFGVVQIYEFGLFFIAPVGVLGLVMMFRRQWRIALLMMLWVLPGSLLYFSYYWGQNMAGIGFLRFFLDLFPPVIIAAFWLVRMAGRAATLDSPRRGSVAIPLAAGLLCAIPAAVGMRISVPEIDRQHVGNLNLAYSGRRVLAHVPPGGPRPVIFADEGMFPQFLMYGQFVVDADWYAADAFVPRFGGGFGFLGLQGPKKDDQPVLVQKERMEPLKAYYRARSPKDLIREQQKVMSDALDQGRPVYLVLNEPVQLNEFKSTFITAPFVATDLERWVEPAGNPATPAEQPLAPGTWRMNLIINWSPQTRHLLKVTRAAATQPATRP